MDPLAIWPVWIVVAAMALMLLAGSPVDDGAGL